MSELDHAKAMVLGAIQGVTEFLPISSSGHLAVAQRWLDLDPDSAQMLLFDVMVHFGTMLAVLIVFAKPAGRYCRRLLGESSRSWCGKRYAWRITMLAVAADAATALLGLTFKEHFEAAFDKQIWIGVCLIITGTLLAALRWREIPISPRRRGRRGWKDFRWWQAGLVGTAQACALLPGISRSGATICVAGYCGLRRRWAVQFSFLIAMPAICGATILKVKDTLELPHQELTAVPWGPAILGSVVSFGVGVLALKLLLDVVRRAKLHYFALYCWILGAFVLRYHQ